MKNHAFSATLVSLLVSTAATSTAGDHASRYHSSCASATAFTALTPLPVSSTPCRFGSGGGGGGGGGGGSHQRRSTRTRPPSRHATSTLGKIILSGPDSTGRRVVDSSVAAAAAAAPGLAAAGAGLEMTATAASAASRLAGGSPRWRRQQQQQQQRRLGRGGGGQQQQRGWFTRGAAAAAGAAGFCADEAGALSATRRPVELGSADADEAGGGAGVVGGEDRCMRRLDTAVRRIFADYYSCTDVRETKESLGVFLKEASATLELLAELEQPEEALAARLSSRLKSRLLESSERLNYHLDGDQPMTLYRFWIRGRPIDIYERDLLHCPRWIELIAETKKQMESPPVVVEGPMGTVCYPSGDIFEGEVDSLVRIAKAGKTPPASSSFSSSAASLRKGTNSAPVFDAEMSSPSDTSAAAAATTSSSSSSGSGGGSSGGGVASGVQTISGLVALTIDCLEDGLSDETTILQRHINSPDFGHPLLRLASPSDNDPDHPHIPDDPEMNPALLKAEAELTEEDLALGERGAKELMLDRRRAQLDVYLICAAYRQFLPLPSTATEASGSSNGDPWQLDEDDARRLDEMIKQAVSP